jgi:hypothetical protein
MMNRANREIKTKGMLAGLGNEDKKFICSKKLKITKTHRRCIAICHPVFFRTV